MKVAGSKKKSMSRDEISQIKDYLMNFDLFKGKEHEGINYLNDSLERFLITLELISETKQKIKLLELGANPYFMTLLIKKFRNCEIHAANYFGNAHEDMGNYSDTIFNQKYNERHEFKFKYFNVEKNIFPFKNNEFDAVLCCEIIEHLGLDPTHMLYEIHRILKSEGCLIITTPNVSRLTNMSRLLTGKNIYDPYSGYGVYGRHNREYTLDELLYLLKECNYDIIKGFAEDTHHHSVLERVISSFRPNFLSDNLFVIAKPKGKPRYRYPVELYRSMYSVLNISRGYVIIGENDVTQIGEGWYDLEKWPPYIRWTGGRAIAYLKNESNSNMLSLTAMTHVSLNCNITINKKYTHSFTFMPSKWQTMEVKLPEQFDDVIKVMIKVEKTWTPANGDVRELGIAVQSINLI